MEIYDPDAGSLADAEPTDDPTWKFYAAISAAADFAHLIMNPRAAQEIARRRAAVDAVMTVANTGMQTAERL